jgi:hypothetical protein
MLQCDKISQYEKLILALRNQFYKLLIKNK